MSNTKEGRPLDVLHLVFWGNLAAYCINLLDETMMAGGFVAGIQEHFWPEYTATKFFWFNTVFIVLIATSNILYDVYGQRLVVAPMAWLWERSLNGLWHLGWTVGYQEYSPGLLTSILFWILLYMCYRHGVRSGEVGRRPFFIGAAIGLGIEGVIMAALFSVQ
ncbi:MAG: hypothetical protein HY897_19840 [Deltaproteobacteria bacterium]|nr:hypothetical protein [Deltaproteobacteria bacterium]